MAWGLERRVHAGLPGASLNHICYTTNGVVFYCRSLTNVNGARLLLIDTRDRLAHAAKFISKQQKAEEMNLQLKHCNDFFPRTDSARSQRWQQESFLLRQCAEIATAR